MFPDNNCGSGIIVTTRIENVAKAGSPSIGGHDHIHQMEALDHVLPRVCSSAEHLATTRVAQRSLKT